MRRDRAHPEKAMRDDDLVSGFGRFKGAEEDFITQRKWLLTI
jgi:hypothetical protein